MQRRKFDQYFWLNKFLMQSCGILPMETRNFIINFLYAFIPFVMCGFLAIPAVYSMTFGWNLLDSKERANIFSDHVELVAAAIKVMALLVKRQKVLKLAKTCSENWYNVDVENDDEYRRISKFPDQALGVTYGFSINVLIALISILIAPLITELMKSVNNITMIEIKQLPYSTGYFQNIITYYYIFYVLQVIAGFMSIIQILAPDTAFVFFSLHGCAGARLCQNNYRKIKQNLIRHVEDSVEYMDKKYQLIDCINQHKNLLEYCHTVEDVFTIIALIQMVLSITTICIFGFNLLLQPEEKVKYIVHLVGAVLQLWLFCWPAHNLQLETTAIAQIVYDLPWHDWPANDRKLVQFIIARSQKPAKITIGKLAIVSIETFSSTISTALSFFTVLRQVV